MNEVQAYLVEWEHVSPRCAILRLRNWNKGTAQQEAREQDEEVRA